jgi:hypothetical protein
MAAVRETESTDDDSAAMVKRLMDQYTEIAQLAGGLTIAIEGASTKIAFRPLNQSSVDGQRNTLIAVCHLATPRALRATAYGRPHRSRP